MLAHMASRITPAHWAMMAQTFIAGTSFSFARTASIEFNPFVLAFLRLTGSALIFGVLFFSRGGLNGVRPTASEWIRLFALAFVGITSGQFLFLYGLKFTTPASSAVLYAMTPLWVLLISVMISQSERLTKRKLFAIAMAISGGLTALFGSGKTIDFAENAWLGNFITLGAVWCWASYLAFGKKILVNYDAIQGTALMMMLGALMFFPIGIAPTLSCEWSMISSGAWFGEGTVLKNETRRYDTIALRDTRLALMDRVTFMWLMDNSVAFNRFMVGQLNERLGQFMALLEYGRMLDPTARIARTVASMFNPILYPDLNRYLDITQEELGAISGISRQNANKSLKALEKEGLLRLEYGGVTILDLDRLRSYGD